jgi:hypothetical protein
LAESTTMYDVSYTAKAGEPRQTRVPKDKVILTESAVTQVSGNLVEHPTLAETLAPTHPTEFTDCERIHCLYKKKPHFITAKRHDGKLYRLSDQDGNLVGPVPADKVAIVREQLEITVPTDTPAAPQQEPAAPTAAAPIGWSSTDAIGWERQMVAIANIKGSAISQTQTTGRYNNEGERDYRDKMLLGLWEYDRPGSEPRLFWDGTEYHTGDGHHTAQSLQAAIDWFVDQAGLDADGISVEIGDRFRAGLIDLPITIPCFVAAGGEPDAKRYSRRFANRFNGMRLTNEQKRGGAWDTITDREGLRDVIRYICHTAGKDFAKFADTIPGDRAIASYLGNVSAPTVAEVWAEALVADEQNDDTQWPWLLATSRMGLDGKVQKIKVKEPKPEPKSPATPPQVKKLTPDPEPIGDDAVDRWSSTDRRSSGNSVSAAAGDAAETSDPAPTNSAPVTPGQTYSGKARFPRMQAIAEEAATKMVQTIAAEMKTKIPATEAYDALVTAIRQELEYYVTGEGG